MAGFFGELKRRRVYQSAAIYAVAAWGLAQVVDFVAERLFLPDWVPTITAIVFVIGFPVVIFLSWGFDLGKDGLRRAEPYSARGLLTISAALLMLIGGTALVYSIVWPRQQQSEALVHSSLDANSIAVLPFTMIGAEGESDYISEGIAEEIIYALGSLEDLRVAARRSSFNFRGPNVTPSEVARALNVRHVIDGTVRLTDDRLTVRVSLLRGDTDRILWSERYERIADDVFKVQQDIADSIADVVREEMGLSDSTARPRFRAQSASTDAYRLYLQGRFLWHQRGPENILSAISFFEQALELDPEFAAAWAGLASAFLTAQTYGADVDNNFARAADAAHKAISLDSTLGEPYGALSQIEKNAGDFAATDELIQKGLEVDPNSISLRLWYATALIQVGRSTDAAKQIALVLERDPAYPVLRANIGMSNFAMGNLEVTREHFEKAWSLGFRPHFMWYGMMMLIMEEGDHDAATAWLEQLGPSGNAEQDELYLALMNKWIEASRAGSESRIQAVVDDVREMVDKGYLSGNSAVYILASIGETEKAITIHLERARRGAYVDQGQLWLPAMRDLRLDPRFAEIAEAVNLVSYWRQVEWPDKCGPTDGENWACFN